MTAERVIAFGRPSKVHLAAITERAEEAEAEVASLRAEHADFAASVREAAWRIGKLLEADLLVEAHSTAGGLFSAAIRRLRQLDSDEGTAA